MGIEEYFYQNAWCLVEWPENIENLLPLEAVEIHLSLLKDNISNKVNYFFLNKKRTLENIIPFI